MLLRLARLFAHLLLLGCGLGEAACRHASQQTEGRMRMRIGQAKDEPEDAALARAALVRQIAADGTVRDRRVLAAIGSVKRHEFVGSAESPAPSVYTAYRDEPLPIGFSQTISQPYVVALMSQALSLQGGERVLEIGTGSGYQAAVLSLLCSHVDSIEVIPELAATAKARLARLGYHNVAVHVGDGYKGFAAGAPYDRILLTAAPPEIPEALLQELRLGGILVAPVGPSPAPKERKRDEPGFEQRLLRIKKTEAGLVTEDLGAVRFVPMVPGPAPLP
jgi:protein-L-isoaspartate(D-aspartate) O-methyltransferase